MLGISGTELVIILALALLLLGPDQLPGLARSLGKGMRELRRATDDLKSTFEQEMARVDLDAPALPRIAPVKPLEAAAPEDPGEARAKARAQAQLKLVAPQGTVAAGAAADATAAAPAADAAVADARAGAEVAEKKQ